MSRNCLRSVIAPMADPADGFEPGPTSSRSMIRQSRESFQSRKVSFELVVMIFGLGRLGSLWFELKRVWFVLRLRLLKLVRRSSLRVEVERGVRVEGRVSINLYRGSAGRVRIGAGSRLGHGVLAPRVALAARLTIAP